MQKNLKKGFPHGACWKILQNFSVTGFIKPVKECQDVLFISLINLVWSEKNSTDIAFWREQVLRAWQQQSIDRRIYQLNLINGLVWDVSDKLYSEPTDGELLLFWPELSKIQSQLFDGI